MDEDLDIAILQNDITRPNGAELVSMMQAENLGADFWCLRYDEEIFPEIAEKIEINEYGYSFALETPFSTTFNTLSPAFTDPSFLKDYDVIICHQDLTEILAYRAKKRYGASMIWYMHNVSDFLYHTHNLPLPLKLLSKFLGLYLKPLDKKAFEAADRIFTNSAKNLEEVVEPIFGNDSRLQPLHPPIRSMEGNRGEEKDFVLVISRIAPYKNLDQVISEMSGRSEKVKFAGVIKDEKYMDEVREKASREGLEVEFLGYVSDNRLEELVSNAKFGIYPSDEENFGLVPLEMIKAGTPCFVRPEIGATEVLPNEYILPINHIPNPDDLNLSLNQNHFQGLKKAIEEIT